MYEKLAVDQLQRWNKATKRQVQELVHTEAKPDDLAWLLACEKQS